MGGTINKFFDIVVPRFMTEVVAFGYSDKHQAYIPVCSIKDVNKGEKFMYGVLKSFNLFGMALFPSLDGELFNLTWSQIENYQKGLK